MQNEEPQKVHRYIPKWLGFRGIVVIALGIIGLTCFFATLKVPEIRSDKRLIACGDNLHRIATAMSRYYRATGKLPPTCVRDDHGNPLLSGRVLLLPYLGAQDVYDKIDQREPWNSEQNRAALQSRTDLGLPFHCPADFIAANDDTAYVFVGDCGFRLLESDCGQEAIVGLPRDETNTVIMIEVKDWGINWAEPRDATADDIRRLIKQHGLASPHHGVINVLLRDGRVVWLHTDYFEEILDRSLSSENKGRP